MRVGRNEPCNCGSGKKYKNCCEGKSQLPKGLMLAVAGVATFGALGLIPLLMRKDDASSRIAGTPATPSGTSAPAAGAASAAVPAPAATGTPGAAQPPGPVPPGKVWSAEHGHWHDANPTSPIQISGPGAAAVSTGMAPPTAPLADLAASGPPKPQPPGPAPAGKVWSPEHGHWHDAAAAPVLPGQQPGPLAPGTARVMGQEVKVGKIGTPPPPGPAPAGKVWSSEHGHWHDATTVSTTVVPPPATGTKGQ